ncbi:MAG: hypothetical protein IKJ31_06500 [Bacteroidaceae bacterium]|nr:hypothetical protein [Bacteroidaceae bacterium]
MKRNSLIENVKQFAIDGWKLDKCHGLPHWERVERNGLLLATNDVNTTVVRLFAYLHDKWRVDNLEDLEHGKRAAEHLPELRNTLLVDLADDEFELLRKACELHTICHRTGDITIDTCFDADRLDLMRVGITPDPERMATERGAYYARNLNEFCVAERR